MSPVTQFIADKERTQEEFFHTFNDEMRRDIAAVRELIYAD